MSALQTPYFIWDYDLTDADVRAILQGDDKEQKTWLVAGLLESARYQDIGRIFFWSISLPDRWLTIPT